MEAGRGGGARKSASHAAIARLRARGDALIAAARIPKRYEHCELSNFTTDFPGADRSVALAQITASRFVRELDPRDGKGLLLVGGIGTGKTHLAVGILKELIVTRASACLFCDYRELLKQIQNSYNDSVQATELQVLRPVFEAEVLLLDELGAVKPSEWVWDTVSLILNTRYNDNRTTIITTNFADEPGCGRGPLVSGADVTGASGRSRRNSRRPHWRAYALPSP